MKMTEQQIEQLAVLVTDSVAGKVADREGWYSGDFWPEQIDAIEKAASDLIRMISNYAAMNGLTEA